MGYDKMTRLLIKYASNPDPDPDPHNIFFPKRSGPSSIYKGGKSRKRKPSSK